MDTKRRTAGGGGGWGVWACGCGCGRLRGGGGQEKVLDDDDDDEEEGGGFIDTMLRKGQRLQVTGRMALLIEISH